MPMVTVFDRPRQHAYTKLYFNVLTVSGKRRFVQPLPDLITVLCNVQMFEQSFRVKQ
jgi:hypothetical protein